MKKRMLSLLLALVMVLGLIPMTIKPVEAATPTYLDRLTISVDVPVDGVTLKHDPQVHVYSDYIKQFYLSDDLPLSCWVYWTEEGGKVVEEGAKAELGKKYFVYITLKLLNGYQFPTNLENFAPTINGVEVELVQNPDGTWSFQTSFTAIAASKEPLRAYYTDLQLSPYEGNPVEMSVEATGGTNIKYQWYVTYGEGFDTGILEYGGAVPLEDNYFWEGCQTPNFKVRTSFNDTFPEGSLGSNTFPFACVVTSDTDSVILTDLTFAVRSRTVVNEATFNNLNIPTYGAAPDWSVSSGDSSKYTVTDVKWFGPQNSDGSYTTKLVSGNTFAEGTYKCRIMVSVTDAYKFSDSTKATIGKNAATITTLSGRDLNPTGPDSYYIEREFSVTKSPAFTVQPATSAVKSGAKASIQWETNFTPYKTTILTYNAATGQTSVGTMVNPAEQTSTFSAAALDGSYYQIRAYYTDTQYVTSEKFYVTRITDHTLKIAGVTVKDGEFFDDDALTAGKNPLDSTYAYYKDGVLFLVGFKDTSAGIVYSIPTLEIQYLGNVEIQGIYQDPSPVIKGVQNDLYVWGSGTLDISGKYADNAIHVEGDVTFGKGSVTMVDATAYAFNYTKSVTIKDGGTLYCACSQGGFFSNGERQISVLDGWLHIYDDGAWYQTIPNNTVITKGNVYVGKGFNLDQCSAWNGVTGLGSYDSIWIIGNPGASVTVGGVTLYDGDYLNESGVSGRVLKDNYASFKDGVLTLCNFAYTGNGFEYNENQNYYGLIYSESPLRVLLKGENTLTQEENLDTCHGIVATQGVIIDGDGALTINVNGYGALAAQGDVTLRNGKVTVNSSANDGIKTNAGDVVVSGGSLVVDTDYNGINAQRDVLIFGGSLTIYAEDAIRAKRNFTMSDGQLVAIAQWYGVYAGSDVTINGGNFYTYAQGDGIRADYGTATITDGNITVLAQCDGIYAYDDEEKTDILIEGGVIRISTLGYSLNAACSNLCINGGNVILYSTEKTNDADYCAMYAYEKILLSEDVHAGASTETSGTLSNYDPAKNDTYDYVVITPRGSDTDDLTVNCVGKINYTVSGQTVTVNHSLACKVGYLNGGNYVAITATKNGDGTYSFTAPAGVTEVVLLVKGDVSGDGRINVGDTAKLYSHVRGTAKLTDPIAIFAADVSGDGKLNVGDTAKVYSHVKATALLTW